MPSKVLKVYNALVHKDISKTTGTEIISLSS